MLKKLFILLLAIALLGFAYYSANKPSPSAVVPGGADDNTFRPDPRNATFKFDSESITLSQGRSETEDPETGIGEETTLLDESAHGDLNSDSKDDSVVLLARSGGGSGIFIYAAAFVSGPISYKGTNAVFLGDRISPQSVSISNGLVTIKYLDRNPDEALSEEPTVPVTKQFIYKNGEFQER